VGAEAPRSPSIWPDVPDLLDRYSGPGGDPYGQAIITGAMDTTRLGHASPLRHSSKRWQSGT
jgi:hypothetical protein